MNSICGTNTEYHSKIFLRIICFWLSLFPVYAEFGATSTDTATVTFTYGSTTTAKTFNILLRQISCTATWRLVTHCIYWYRRLIFASPEPQLTAPSTSLELLEMWRATTLLVVNCWTASTIQTALGQRRHTAGLCGKNPQPHHLIHSRWQNHTSPTLLPVIQVRHTNLSFILIILPQPSYLPC